MGNVLIRNISERTLKIVKKRARENNRSLQAELKELIEKSARRSSTGLVQDAKQLQDRLKGRRHSDSSRLLAEDRRR